MSDMTIETLYNEVQSVKTDVEMLYNEVHTIKADVETLKAGFVELGEKFDEMKSSTIKWVVSLFVGTVVLMIGSGTLVMTVVLPATQ